MILELPTIILMLGLILTVARLIRGPSLASRVVAFDLMTTIGIGLIAVYAVMTGQPVFLDIAVVLALISFLGTVAFAFYLERSKR
ncbi:MAG: cation:proton antiporter [Chloroflexi bacterium]|nr:cation:proton antiporter [Chloroflexota bacterium]